MLTRTRYLCSLSDHPRLLRPYTTSWLSSPGNPLLPWPSPPPPPSPAPPPPLQLPPPQDPTTTIAHLLRTVPPASLPAALLSTNIPPLPPLLTSLLASSPDHPPATLLALARWSLPHLTPTLLTTLTDLLAKSRSFSSAWSLLLSSPLPLPLPAFAALFRRYCRAGLPHSAVRTHRFLLRHPEVTSQTNVPISDLLVDALCKEGHTKVAVEFLAQTQKSVRNYNMLIHGWFRQRKLKKAERLWEEMRRGGVQPTIVTYGTVIEGLCRMRRPDMAAGLLEEMRAGTNPIQPNEITLNPIVDALAEDGRFKEALGLVERFPVYGVSPNISTYNSLVKGFCKKGDLVGASKVLKKMIGREILPTTTTYNYFFRFFTRFGKIEEGMSLYTKMVNSGYAPDRLTYELLIKMLCEKQRLELVVQLTREMNRNGFDSDLDTSTMMVHLLCRMRKMDEACGEFEGMIKRGIVPQYMTYRMLSKELKRLGMIEMKKKVTELMDSVPHSTKLPDTYREREGERNEAVELRKTIIQKAQVMSEALKASKDASKGSKESIKLQSSMESAVEAADRLISDIRRRVNK